MSQQQLPPLSFLGLDDYKPYEGGGHGFVPQEGLYKVIVDRADAGLTKDGTKGSVKVGGTIQDVDMGAGVHLMDDVLYSGVDSNGKNLARQFADFLVSTGTDPAVIRQQAATGGGNLKIDDVCAQLIGRTAYIELKFDTYNGETRSKIANWILPERYLKAAEKNQHRGMTLEQWVKTKAAAAPVGALSAVNLGGPVAAPVAAAPVAAAPFAAPAAPNAPFAAPAAPNAAHAAHAFPNL